MLNLFIKAGSLPHNMQSLFNLQLIVCSSWIYNFKTGLITSIFTGIRTLEMFKYMRILIWEKMLTNTSWYVSGCFTNIYGITFRTSKFIDKIHRLRSCVVYKFTCAECNSVYVGETSRHISTRVREHLFSDKNSHIFKHLQSSDACKNACNETCFKVIDSARTHYQLKIKEALHIMWEGPSLNKQVQHYNFSLAF